MNTQPINTGQPYTSYNNVPPTHGTTTTTHTKNRTTSPQNDSCTPITKRIVDCSPQYPRTAPEIIQMFQNPQSLFTTVTAQHVIQMLQNYTTHPANPSIEGPEDEQTEYTTTEEDVVVQNQLKILNSEESKT